MPKPVHPILVHFPIALLVGSFVADGAYSLSSLPTLKHVGFWMLAMACVTGALTVLAGLFDMRRATLEEDVHVKVHHHMWVGIGLYAVIAALTAWRWTFYADPGKFLPMVYLDAAFLAVALAGFQGWLGGDLVYKHGVFVAPRSRAADNHRPKKTGGHQGEAADSRHHHSH